MDRDSQEPPTAPFLRFDFSDTLGLPGPVCFSQPERVIVAHDVTEVIAALREVEEGTRHGLYAAGYVAYEAAPAFDDALVTSRRFADALGKFKTALALAPRDAELPGTISSRERELESERAGAATTPVEAVAIEPTAEVAVAAASDGSVEAAPAGARSTSQSTSEPPDAPQPPLVWFGLFRAPRPVTSSARNSVPASASSAAPPWRWEPDITREDYHAGIDAVKEAIARGDTYQVNYTFRLRSDVDGSADSLEARYLQFAQAQRAPYSAYLDLGRWRVLSLSPELFFKIRDRRIVTKPMKGTAARGRWREEDEARAAWLAASEKNRAENVMIVDLARNDVGRIAEIGSVRVASLFEVERYPSVFQLVSTVEGTLRERTTLTDVFTALFPAGSITGAPKSGSMRLIAAIEHAPRGVYCGAIGFVAPSGDAIFNVAIRTAAIDTHTGRAEFGVGGGITWDSTTDAEYAEALSKAACLSPPPAFELLETMKLEDGVIVRRDRHLRRMRESAAYFDVPFDPQRIDAVLDTLNGVASDSTRPAMPSPDGAARNCGSGSATSNVSASESGEAEVGAHRVRLLLSQSGVPRVERTPLAPCASGDVTSPTPTPLPVVLARAPVSSQDVFLFHKTTNRAVYDAHARAIDRVAHPDAFDVLLWNEAREVTEFTIGNVIVEIDGERFTPPRRCGLLAGTLRAELLEQRAIRERVITLDELASAGRLWLINSVRGQIEVRLVGV